jgi:adenylate kinase
MKVVITGVKASGKTTTVQLVQEIMPKVKVLVVGDYFQKTFKEVYGDKAKREMTEEIDRKSVLDLQRKVARQLAEDARGAEDVLIDTNLLFIRQTGFFPGLTEEFLRILDPDVIAVMEVYPEAILERRLKDEKRTGEEITEAGTIAKQRIRHAGKSIGEVETEQETQRSFALNCAFLIGCSVKIINLRFKEKESYEHAKVAAEEIVKIMKM